MNIIIFLLRRKEKLPMRLKCILFVGEVIQRVMGNALPIEFIRVFSLGEKLSGGLHFGISMFVYRKESLKVCHSISYVRK